MLDRIYDFEMKKETFDALHQMAVEVFCLTEESSRKLPQDMSTPYYSYMKKDYNDYYTKCSEGFTKEIMSVEELIDEYN
jgi:hypothetical protein